MNAAATPRLTELDDRVRALIRTLDGGAAPAHGALMTDLEEISAAIQRLGAEISGLRLDRLAALVPHSTLQLDAVVRATADATHNVLDAVDSLDAAMVETGCETCARLRSFAARIYEACTFQDIAGQRIHIVVQTLGALAQDVDALAAILMLHPAANEASDAVAPAAAAGTGDDRLENGPQLPGEGQSQDDIDSLFD